LTKKYVNHAGWQYFQSDSGVKVPAVMLIPRNYIDINPELYESCSVYPVREINQERHFYICRPKEHPLTLFEQDFIRIFRPDFR